MAGSQAATRAVRTPKKDRQSRSKEIREKVGEGIKSTGGGASNISRREDQGGDDASNGEAVRLLTPAHSVRTQHSSAPLCFSHTETQSVFSVNICLSSLLASWLAISPCRSALMAPSTLSFFPSFQASLPHLLSTILRGLGRSHPPAPYFARKAVPLLGEVR